MQRLIQLCIDKVAHAVEIEPHLEPLTGLSGEHLQPRTAVRGDQARLDVVANGVYGGRFERSFLDGRVFNPYARSNSSSSIASVYRKHEQEKRRLYEARVREVEHASFIPVVYATSGGAGRSANAVVKRIASLMAEKKLQPYSQVMAWLRSKISISLSSEPLSCACAVQDVLGHASISTRTILVWRWLRLGFPRRRRTHLLL